MPNNQHSEDIFLSYSKTNEAEAINLRNLLKKQSFSVFRDADSIIVGDNWSQRLQNILRGCSAFVLLIGGKGIEDERWTGVELNAALTRQKSPQNDEERLPIYPILLPGADTSTSTSLKCRVKMLQFYSDIISRKAPLHITLY